MQCFNGGKFEIHNWYFFRKPYKINKFFMVPLVLKENVRRYFRLAGKMLFPVQQNFPIEEWKKLDFVSYRKQISMKFKRTTKTILS